MLSRHVNSSRRVNQFWRYEPRVGVRSNLETHGIGKSSLPNFFLNRFEQIVSIFPGRIDLGAPCYPKRHDREDFGSGKQLGEVVRYYFAQTDQSVEAVAVGLAAALLTAPRCPLRSVLSQRKRSSAR